MKILTINGSPRRDLGNTERVLSAISTRAQEQGADIDTMYLVDENPEYCTHCGHGCFADGECAVEGGATGRSERIRSADAIILGVPVYCWQPNALTCALFDKFRIPRGTWVDSSEPGIPAMGIAVAGGTGTGVFPALQSIYAWFCAWRFAPIGPVPVTRYNVEPVIDEAGSLARALLSESAGKAAFDARWNHMLLYDELPFMSFGRIDEYEWLARRMVGYLGRQGSHPEARSKATELLEQAAAELRAGDGKNRAKLVMSGFDQVFPLCR